MTNNIFKKSRILIFLFFLIFPLYFTFAETNYGGKILFENESNKFYYANPKDSKIYELTKNNFSSLFKKITIGLKNSEISRVLSNKNLLNKYKGKFLLETTGRGRLFYIDFNSRANEIKTKNLENDLKNISEVISNSVFNSINQIKLDENENIIQNTIRVIINSSDEPKDIDFNPFYNAWNYVKSRYSGNLDYKKMLDGAISGMVSSLEDDYSTFMNKESSESFMIQLTGDVEGIGAQIELKGDYVTIIAPIDSSPAQRAGLRPGDKILEINDVNAKGMSSEKAASLIRGQAGTVVKLKILRIDGSENTYSITREKIHVPIVSSEIKNGNVGYIKIMSFGIGADTLLNQAIDDLIKKGADRFIVDLRNNPGGYLDVAVRVAGVWIDNKIVVIQKYKEGIPDNNYTSGSNVKIKNQKTIILVNGGSASASEILAGALQDYKLATIVGEKTFGKGSVQEMINMSDGSSLKVTTSKWYTPNGLSIEGNGIIPDVLVKNFDNLNIDNQLEQALMLIK